jgi:hypothetical protein
MQSLAESASSGIQNKPEIGKCQEFQTRICLGPLKYVGWSLFGPLYTTYIYTRQPLRRQRALARASCDEQQLPPPHAAHGKSTNCPSFVWSLVRSWTGSCPLYSLVDELSVFVTCKIGDGIQHLQQVNRNTGQFLCYC